MALSIGASWEGHLNFGAGPSSITTNSDTTPASGFVVVAASGIYQIPSEQTAPTDNKGNTYAVIQDLIAYPVYGPSGVMVWTDTTAVGGSGHTLTKGCNAGSEAVITGAAVIGGEAIEDCLGLAISPTTDNASYTSRSITVAGEAILLCWFHGELYLNADPTATGWTLLKTYNGDATSIQASLFYRSVTAGTYSCTIQTNSPAQGAVVSIVAVRGPLATYNAVVDPLPVPLAISAVPIVWTGAPPNVASEGGNESGTANVTTFNAQIGSPPNGSRVVGVITKDGSADFSSLPSGWTVASNNLQGTAIRSAVVWKNCNGTEGATIPFGVSSAEAFVWHYWQLDAGTFDPGSAPAVAVNAVATANNNPAAVTPIWGSANNLCLCTLAMDTNSTAPSGYPSGYTTGQGSLRSTNTTTSDRTRLTWCRKTAVGSSEDPGAWTSSAVASVAYTILIRPATYSTQYTQSCVCTPVSSTTTLKRRPGKKSQSLPVATLAIKRLPGVKRAIASATTVLAKRRAFSKRTQTGTITTTAKRQAGRKSTTTTTGTVPSTSRRSLLKQVIAIATTTQFKNRIAAARKTTTTSLATLGRRVRAVRSPSVTASTSMSSRVILGLITKSVLIFENSVITVKRQVRTKKSQTTTGTTSVVRRASKRMASVITGTTTVLHPLIVGTHRLTITVVSSLSTVARRRVITAKRTTVTGTIPRTVRAVRSVKLLVVATTTLLKRSLRVAKRQTTTTELDFSAIGVKLLTIAAATVSTTTALRRRALSIRRATATSSVGILRRLRVAKAASLSVAMQLFKRPGIKRSMSMPVVLFASRITQQSLHVLAQTLTSSTTALRRDIKVRRLSLTALTPRVRKAATATRVAVGRVIALPRKQVRPQPFSSTTTATGRLVKRAQLRARTLLGSLVSVLAERTVAQIYPLTFGRRHPANPWRGRLTHKALPMDKLWTTLEKRTAEVLDIAVDWTDILSARGEIAIATVEWSIDPTHPGDATLAGIPYQPRLDGNVAKARVAAGNTTDTLFICKVTFRSGQTEIDKTLIKWIP